VRETFLPFSLLKTSLLEQKAVPKRTSLSPTETLQVVNPLTCVALWLAPAITRGEFGAW